ncbi:hypothetical protein TrST_g8571 [Triparma strigata]|uniref:Guanylate cyclase domain-containing protein n=1 Tax=Triparma strigata TaxID=1606541 RepID=A0A9W6ZIS2_9STRA|nr:hypothetical protein TrST_g8571 [Triparma strigata]
MSYSLPYVREYYVRAVGGGEGIITYPVGYPDVGAVVGDVYDFGRFFESETQLNYLGRLNTYNIKVSTPLGHYTTSYSTSISTSLLHTSILSITLLSILSLLTFYFFFRPLLEYVVIPLEEVKSLTFQLDKWPETSETKDYKGLETRILIESLETFKELLAVALGRGGLKIYKDWGDGGGGGGREEVDVVFVFTDIREFTRSTEVLEDNVFRWLNWIAGSIHSGIRLGGGVVVRNVGDAFFAVWEKDGKGDEGGKVLAGVVWGLRGVVVGGEEGTEWLEEETKRRLKEEDLMDVKLGFGLTTGKAVLGGMGSDEKIDVNYVGVGGEAAEVLESRTKLYGVYVLMDEGFWEGLEETLKNGCRYVGDHDGRVYAFDLDLTKATAAEGGRSQKKWTENIFATDTGLIAVRRKFDKEFFRRWRDVERAWEEEEFEKCMDMVVSFKDDYDDGVARVWEGRCGEKIEERERTRGLEVIQEEERRARERKSTETWYGDFMGE